MKISSSIMIWMLNGVLALVATVSVLTKNQDSKTTAEETQALSKSRDSRTSHSINHQLVNGNANRSTLANKILTTHWLELGDSAESFQQSFDLESPEGEEALRKIVNEIASELPAHALDFLGLFPGKRFIRVLERDVLTQWINQDKDQVLAHYSERTDYTSLRHFGALVQAFSNNRDGEDLDDFFDWFSELGTRTEKERDFLFLQRAIGGQFADYLRVEHYPKAIEVMAKNAEVVDDLRSIIPRYGQRFPQKASSWLVENRDNLPYETYVDVLGGLMEAWSNGSNREKASEFLQRDDFFTSIYRPKKENVSVDEQDAEKSLFHDTLLESFVVASLAAHPEEAYFHADLFFNPQLKQEYQAWAAELVSKSPAEPASL